MTIASPQATQDEGEREHLRKIIEVCRSGDYTNGEIADTILAADYSRRTDETLFTRLRAANGLLRSAYQVAQRSGYQTNWGAFEEQLKKELEAEHPLIYGRELQHPERPARTEATGEARAIAERIVYERRDTDPVDDIARAITEGARAAEERATRAEKERCMKALCSGCDEGWEVQETLSPITTSTYWMHKAPDGTKFAHRCLAGALRGQEQKP